MLKFMLGPIAGAVSGLGLWQTFGLTVFGMMTSVVLAAYLGQWLRAFVKTRLAPKLGKSKLFTRGNRRLVTNWNRYGLPGVAFMTPILLSPIGGTLLAVSFGETPRRIVPAMLASALFWGLALTWLARTAGTYMPHWAVG